VAYWKNGNLLKMGFSLVDYFLKKEGKNMGVCF
jgi:hypothetical protein